MPEERNAATNVTVCMPKFLIFLVPSSSGSFQPNGAIYAFTTQG